MFESALNKMTNALYTIQEEHDEESSEYSIKEEDVDEILDSFIVKRPTVPDELENNIMTNTKEWYKKSLIGKTIKKKELLPNLKDSLMMNHFKSLIQPGETVGIIAGQCIGERTTQSSLNNFHSAGLDTGSTSQIDSIQNIINSSNTKKKEIRQYIITTLYLHDKPTTVNELNALVINNLKPVAYSEIIQSVSYRNVKVPEMFRLPFQNSKGLFEYKLKLSEIFTLRLNRKKLSQGFVDLLGEENIFVVPFSSLTEADNEVSVYGCYGEDFSREQFFNMHSQLKNKLVCGIKGVGEFVYLKSKKTTEWYVECMSENLSVFFEHQHIYDMSRSICNSVHEINEHFGVLVAQTFIKDKCGEILSGVHESHFKLLATKMTQNGTIEPLTRYTMRNNVSPLSKASFEESFETFLKASKFKEKETFKSLSSSIICGKKPKVGTYNCEILIDPTFYV